MIELFFGIVIGYLLSNNIRYWLDSPSLKQKIKDWLEDNPNDPDLDD